MTTLPRQAPGANLALKFGLELVTLAAFAYWGATITNGPRAVVMAVAAPVAAATLWGLVAAPRAQHRLPAPQRVVFELAVFALAALALLALSTALAATFTLLVIANTWFLTRSGHSQADQRPEKP